MWTAYILRDQYMDFLRFCGNDIYVYHIKNQSKKIEELCIKSKDSKIACYGIWLHGKHKSKIRYMSLAFPRSNLGTLSNI